MKPRWAEVDCVGGRAAAKLELTARAGPEVAASARVSNSACITIPGIGDLHALRGSARAAATPRKEEPSAGRLLAVLLVGLVFIGLVSFVFVGGCLCLGADLRAQLIFCGEFNRKPARLHQLLE